MYRQSVFKLSGNMSTTMGVGMSGINDVNESEFFSAAEAKNLFGPTEIKPDVMQIPVQRENLANGDNI